MTIESDRQKVIQFAQDHGEFVVVEDGFTVFWPRKINGYLNAHDLRWIADELDRRNSPVYKSIQEYFDAHWKGVPESGPEIVQNDD